VIRAGASESVVTKQFIAFAMVGTVGFVVDASTLYLAMGLLNAGLYGGRVISYLVAATVTWSLNRRYTFHRQRRANKLAEWCEFLGANAIGGLVNYGTYAILVSSYAVAAAHPIIGVAAGSVAGLAVNFCLSRYVVFRAS
jgi:putative flippase GtrA